MIPEVVEQVEEIVKDVLNNGMHTAMPGKVMAIDAENGVCDVQPVGSFYCGNTEMQYPMVPSVPICLMANSDDIAACIPLKAGDDVLLVVAEQSLSAWLTDTSKEQSNEKFELMNCIAIPGLMKSGVKTQQEANEEDAYILDVGTSRIKVKKDAEIELITDNCKVTIGEDGAKVEGDVKVEGNVEIEGDISATGSVSITGNVDIEGNLTVTGEIKGQTIDISQGGTFGGDLDVTGHIHSADDE